jgi:hypothetical protein
MTSSQADRRTPLLSVEKATEVRERFGTRVSGARDSATIPHLAAARVVAPQRGRFRPGLTVGRDGRACRRPTYPRYRRDGAAREVSDRSRARTACGPPMLSLETTQGRAPKIQHASQKVDLDFNLRMDRVVLAVPTQRRPP